MMHYLLIIMWFVGIVSMFTNGDPSIILGCGIFGIINKEEKQFDYSTFCVLGINNDSRGGDSCGVFIDGKVEYGVNQNKLFNDFLYSSNLIQTTETCKIALGHCRKASVGVVSEKTAQPVCICNKDGKIEFVLMHNGTIWNYEELAKKYIPWVNILGMSDSQVMAHIFYYKGFDVLGEYKGGAVFVAVDYRHKEPNVFLFKGSSYKNKWAKEMIEERPLFISKSEGELVFSSIRKYLEVLRPDNELQTIHPNCLLGYKNGKFYKLKEFDRKECYQDKPYTAVYRYNAFSDEGDVFTPVCTSCRCNTTTNQYLIEGKPAFGEYWMGKYGTVWHKKPEFGEQKKVWFFNGILIPKQESYDLINKMYKKFDLDDPELFVECFEVIIRYLSYDQIFNVGGNSYVKVLSPTRWETYTGDFQMVGSSSITKISNGELKNTIVCGGKYPEIENFPNIDLAEVKKIWRQLMK